MKQSGVLSHILIAVYTDDLLKKLQESGVGCHMGHRVSGACTYADDLTLWCPSRSGSSVLISECEKFATSRSTHNVPFPDFPIFTNVAILTA